MMKKLLVMTTLNVHGINNTMWPKMCTAEPL